MNSETSLGQRIWDLLIRWRTYLVNFLFIAVFTPDVILFFIGFNWGTIIPAKYMPYVILAQGLVNVLMRPRPASRAMDPEVKVRDAIKHTEGPTTIEVKQTDGDMTAVIRTDN